MRPLYLASLLALAAGCTNPSVAGDVQGEPICADFELGAARTKMKGSLKKPVRVSVIEDDEVRWERVMLGKRTATDPDAKFVVEDDDESYTVRWAQCPNVFAPKRVELHLRPEDISSSYACGEAVTYHEQTLEIRQGDPSSRVLTWASPPEPGCWESSVPEEETDASDAGAPDAGAEERDAGAEDADAGAGGAPPDGGADATKEAEGTEPTEPKPTAPKPTAPKPTAPKPTEPKPVEPKPTAPKSSPPPTP